MSKAKAAVIKMSVVEKVAELSMRLSRRYLTEYGATTSRHGSTLFPEHGFESLPLTCVNNGAEPGGRTVDAAKLQKLVKERGFLIDGGYGKIKGTTFRISNMGDETEASMNPLIAALDEAMKQL